MLSSTLFALAGLVSLSTAGYVLEDDYSGDSFFSMFDFFTGADPTNGFVDYVDQSTAQSSGLISTSNGSIYMGVDSTNVASSAGRPSVRLTSTKSYTHALIILDLEHMPGGVCGTWPAFWTVGPNWPNAGEIDIIEGVNSQVGDSMALHTSSGCSISKSGGDFSGSVTTPNCYVDASGQATNAGCAIVTSESDTYGTGFNNGQGGVYATEWTSSAITIWFFPRSSIPSDITSGNPDPSNWGTPLSSFTGGCDIDQFFEDHQIVFDTTFCGDWAGNVWTTDATCSSKASTCQDFVQNNPSAFVDAYWSVNSLKVYQSNGASSNSTATASPGGSTASIPAIIPVSSGGSSKSGAGWSFPAASEATAASSSVTNVPTAGFSRGGNGRFSKTFGTAADFAAAVATSASDSISSIVAEASGSMVIEATVTATATATATGVATSAAGGSSAAEITSAAAVKSDDDSNDSSNGERTHYVTVTALTYEEVTGDQNNDKKRAAATQGADLDKVKRQMQSHRHVHRHLFRHGGAARGSVEE